MIKAKLLSYQYQDQLILDNLSFTVEKNQFVSFIGPSGCGKTTLLNLISHITNSPRQSLQVATDKVSFVFQHDTLIPWRSALQNVLLPIELSGKKIDQYWQERAEFYLQKVGLKEFEKYYPQELSGGMKKRVEIARALITKPDLLILDEPFSSLDIITREKLNLLIQSIKWEAQTTIVLVTHSVEEACFLSDKIFVLSPAPARIIDIKEVNRALKPELQQFILSNDQLKIDKQIRQAAKLLWSAPVFNHSSKKQQQTKQSFTLLDGLKKLFIPLQLIFIFFLFSLVKSLFKINDYLFPAPLAILKRFISTITDHSIFPHLLVTMAESLSGFFLALLITLILGYAIAKSRIISKLIMPYLIAFNTLPSVALAPFLVLWFGFGYIPKTIISVIVIFFPMLINNISAIRIASHQMQTLVQFYKPNKINVFVNFELPASLPIIFSGIKVSITLSVIGAVVGEFISGSTGLGALVVTAKANFDTELMFVSLIWLIMLGLSYYGLAVSLYNYVINKLHK